MKKYILTDTKKELSGVTLYQIKAIRSFGEVKEGDLGGWIEKEENLSHDGFAWIHNDAHVYGNAKVYGNAQVFGNAWVFGNAQVSGDSRIESSEHIFWASY